MAEVVQRENAHVYQASPVNC